MAERRARWDKYGKPLPTPVPAERQSLAETETNKAQRARLLRCLAAKLEEHVAHLFRADVNAEVALSFKIVRGTAQEDIRLGIVWQYQKDEE